MVMHNPNIMFVLFVSAFDIIQQFCNNKKCEANLLNFNEHLFNRCRHEKIFLKNMKCPLSLFSLLGVHCSPHLNTNDDTVDLNREK